MSRPRTIPQAMILAAGFGTRLRPHTLLCPKPLFPVLNRPLLHILLDQVLESGCKRVVVNGHHLAGQIRAALAGYHEAFFQEEETILGTGGSLRRAAGLLADAPLLVMNGDIVHNVDMGALYEHHRKSGNLVTMALHDHARFNSVVVGAGRVRGFGRDLPGRKLAFTGIHVVDAAVLARIPDNTFFHIIDLYQELAREEAIGFLRVDGSYWQDMGTPVDYLRVHRDLLMGPARGVIAGAGRRQGNWLVADGVHLGADVRLECWGCLGAGAVVGSGACLRRSIVWPGARVAAGATCKDSIVTGGEC